MKEEKNSNPSRAIQELSGLLKEEDNKKDIQFIAENCAHLIDLLEWFEWRQINIHKVYNRIMDLLSWAKANSEDYSLPAAHRKAFQDIVSNLMQYYTVEMSERKPFRQQDLQFMKAVRLFDPQKAKLLSFEGFADAIPCISSNSQVMSEIIVYKNAVLANKSDVSPLLYWSANSDRFPELTNLALRYLSTPTSSVDAERSVSQYTRVNAPQSQGFNFENLALQTMFAFNKC